jgi:hypothetical protein
MEAERIVRSAERRIHREPFMKKLGHFGTQLAQSYTVYPFFVDYLGPITNDDHNRDDV